MCVVSVCVRMCVSRCMYVFECACMCVCSCVCFPCFRWSVYPRRRPALCEVSKLQNLLYLEFLPTLSLGVRCIYYECVCACVCV